MPPAPPSDLYKFYLLGTLSNPTDINGPSTTELLAYKLGRCDFERQELRDRLVIEAEIALFNGTHRGASIEAALAWIAVHPLPSVVALGQRGTEKKFAEWLVGAVTSLSLPKPEEA